MLAVAAVLVAAGCVAPPKPPDASAADARQDYRPEDRVVDLRGPDLEYCDPVTQAGCANGQCEIDFNVGRPACSPKVGTLGLNKFCTGPSQCLRFLQCGDGICMRPCHSNADCVAPRQCREAGATVSGLPLQYCL